MRLAALQYRPEKGHPDVSRRALRTLIREAAAHRADIIVCPEMATSGYVWPDAEALAPHAEVARGPTYDMLSEEARIADAWIVCGFPECADDVFYNSALVVNPNGDLVAVYRKMLLFDADQTWAAAGDQRVMVPTAFGGLAPAIYWI